MHQVNSRLASACPSTEANIIGISRVKLPLTREKSPPTALPGAPPPKKRASTASAGPSITCIGWTLAWQLPRPKKRASSASGGLLLVKLPEHHLHQVDSRLAVAPPEEASIVGIRRAAPCQTAQALPASGGLSLGSCPARRSEHHRHQEGCSLSNCPSILSLGSCPARRSEHHRHQEGCSLSNCPSIICIRWTLAWQLPRPKKRASSAPGGLLLVKLPQHQLHEVDSCLAVARPKKRASSASGELLLVKLPEHHLHQVDSRLAVAPPEEASIIGIRRAAPYQTAQASPASGGPSLGSCPARRSEHHRHQEGCSLSNCSSILSLGSCPARRSEHHRHQEGCSLSNCPSIICIRWTLAWQLPRLKKRASSAPGGLLLVKLPQHHLHQVDSRLAVARPKKPASSASGGLLLVKLPEHHLHQVDSCLAVAPPEEASIIGIRRAAPCQTARASSASGGLSLARSPPPGKRASSASAGLLLVNYPSIICITWSCVWLLHHKEASIVGIHWAASSTSTEHHLHQWGRGSTCQARVRIQADFRLAGAPPPPPRPRKHRPKEASITSIGRPEHHLHVPAKEASIIRISWATSFTDAKREASIISRCPPKEASIIGISWSASCTGAVICIR